MKLCYDSDVADLHQVLACHPDPGIRREAQGRLYHGYPWCVLEPAALKLLNSLDTEDRHWANRTFRVAPLPLYQARLQALLAENHPSSRQDAIALLEHNRYRWPPLAKLQPVEFKAHLRRLAEDTDPEVRRRGRLLLWELGMSAVADLQGLARADMPSIDLAELCLDRGQWDPALEMALLDLALRPLEDAPTPEGLETEATLTKVFGRTLPRSRPEEHRLRGIRQLLPAMILASPEDCLRLGRRVLDEAPEALRMAGPILMGMAGEPGFMEALHLAGGADLALARAARIGAASARAPHSRAFLRWLLMACEGDTRRRAARPCYGGPHGTRARTPPCSRPSSGGRSRPPRTAWTVKPQSGCRSWPAGSSFRWTAQATEKPATWTAGCPRRATCPGYPRIVLAPCRTGTGPWRT